VHVMNQSDSFPVASIPQNLVGRVGEGVVLQGTVLGVDDPAATTAQWIQLQGTRATFSDDTSPVTTVYPVEEGVYRFRLDVSLGDTVGRSAETTVTVTGADSPPWADAGQDQLDARTGVEVTLDGTGSGDAEGAVSYTWSQILGPTVVLSDSEAVSPSFTPEVTRVYGFELVTFDGVMESVPDQVFIVVNSDENTVPVARVRKDTIVTSVGNRVVLNGVDSYDGDNADSIVYQWVQTGGPLVVLDDPYHFAPSYVPEYTGTYSFELYVDDSNDRSLPVPVSVTAGEAGSGGENVPGSALAAGPGCFIATAAYGTPMADEIELLRHVRDRFLLAVEPGRELVECYYRYSPQVADMIADDHTRRRFTRTVLSPVVRTLSLAEWLGGGNRYVSQPPVGRE